MESFKRGFEFLKQSWKMALADRDLLKPSIYALVAGFFVTLITLVPIAVVTFFFQGSRAGEAVIYVMGALLIFVQYTVGYIFSAMTVYLIYGYLSEGDGRMDKAWGIVGRDLLDIISLAAASTLVNLLSGAVRGKGKSGVGNAIAQLINTVWTEATFLVLPAMVIEDINLQGGLKRATQIIKNNLLLVGISTVGVKAVTGLLGFLFSLLGILLGVGVGALVVSLSQGETIGIVTGVILGILVATPFILFSIVIGSYTSTAYHTCLYLWARDVEHAQVSGSQAQIPAPGPLAAVLK